MANGRTKNAMGSLEAPVDVDPDDPSKPVMNGMDKTTPTKPAKISIQTAFLNSFKNRKSTVQIAQIRANNNVTQTEDPREDAKANPAITQAITFRFQVLSIASIITNMAAIQAIAAVT